MSNRSRFIQTAAGALALAGGLLLPGCGGSSSGDRAAPGLPGAFEVSTGALSDGGLWQLNRAINIQTNQTIQFTSVQTGSVSVQTADGGTLVQGTYGPGVDPVTGEEDRKVVRFQPACPLVSGGTFGFEPDTDYVLIIRGKDTYNWPLRSTNGEELQVTLEVAFSTLGGADPSILFHDTVPGPPRVSFRGQPGVPLDDPDTTRFEIGAPSAVPVLLRRGVTGLVEVDPGSSFQTALGLPLNHNLVLENRVALRVEFDQAISLSEANLGRIGVEFLDASLGTWHPIPSRAIPLASCGRRGSAVRLELIGTLPPAQPLRIRLDTAFSDLLGQGLPVPSFEVLPLEGATEAVPQGSRVDALFENFFLAGDEPGSMEDIDSVLDAPRGYWGNGIISGIETPDAISVVRSKWYPVGLAGHDGLGAPQAPRFSFAGVDPDGVVLAEAGTVTLGEPLFGPMSPVAVGAYSVDVTLAELVDPTGLYAAQPGLVAGDRLRLRPEPVPGTDFTAQIFGASVSGPSLQLGLGDGCYLPGFPSDCVPWDLSQLFPDSASTTAEIIPRSFDAYTWITRDAHSVDHRVTITFDAARAGANGEVDETTALSATGPWATRVSDLSGQPWDFLRFEVHFNLDVSGDGYQPLERSPVLDFIKVPIDLRR